MGGGGRGGGGGGGDAITKLRIIYFRKGYSLYEILCIADGTVKLTGCD